MKITFLGTGTSHGIPMIGCKCNVCTSTNPKDQRYRCSILIETQEKRILIDTPPELRLQMIREDLDYVDSILFTHSHADHVFGLDDVRRFNDFTHKALPCFGNKECLDTIRQAFEYIFIKTQKGGGKPKIDLNIVDSEFETQGIKIIPIPVKHGIVDVYGYRIGNFAYVTDCSYIPETSFKLLKGIKLLVLGVVRPTPHECHFSLDEGFEVVRRLKPEMTYYTHIAHKLAHDETNSALPNNIQLAYDGLKLTFGNTII